MPRPKKNTVLEALTKKRLTHLARVFEVSAATSRPKSYFVDLLSKSRRASLGKLLDELNDTELRDICIAHQLPSSSGDRDLLITAITGRYRHQSRDLTSDLSPLYLRPFFGYYGGKWRDTPKHYRPPSHDTIIEPFAGSAGYSLRYYNKNVILIEKDPILAEIWKYLLRCTENDILSLPDIEPKQTVDDLEVTQVEKWLIGFWLNRGVESPRKRPSRWMRDGIRPGSFWGPRVRSTIAQQLKHISHWKVYEGDYDSCQEYDARNATWFIDPPYQHAGSHYRFGSKQIDYEGLGQWCASRPGQVIVCENDGANWLPFDLVSDIKTTRRNQRCREVVWYQESTNNVAEAHSSYREPPNLKNPALHKSAQQLSNFR
jgi:site-specific DNA-adenine methylase